MTFSLKFCEERAVLCRSQSLPREARVTYLGLESGPGERTLGASHREMIVKQDQDVSFTMTDLGWHHFMTNRWGVTRSCQGSVITFEIV